MDERIRYKIADRAFARRAALLSRLDDGAQQAREIGLAAAALESAINEKSWGLAEKLATLLMRLRESQHKTRKDSEQLVDIDKFRHSILSPLLDAIANRLKEFLPDDFERIVDLIESDVRAVHPRLLLEGPKQ